MPAAEHSDLRVTKAEEAAYYKEAASWDDDRVTGALKSAKTAWVVASAAGGLTVLLGVGLMLLLPLKRVEWGIVRVDSSTGIVDNVVKLKDATLGTDEVMNKYFLRQYVQLRKNYARGLLQLQYNKLALFTDPSIRPALYNEWLMTAPTSPYAKFGEMGTADVQIVSVTFLQPNIAQIRYIVTEVKGGLQSVTHEISTVAFRYSAAPASEETRALNPLGFLVTGWRTDPEAEPITSPMVASSAAEMPK